MGTLVIPVVQAAFGAGLVASPGGPAGAPTGLPPARITAVGLPAITAAAEVEDRSAKSAPPLTIAVVHHARLWRTQEVR